jgi:hypothetical protein
VGAERCWGAAKLDDGPAGSTTQLQVVVPLSFCSNLLCDLWMETEACLSMLHFAGAP